MIKSFSYNGVDNINHQFYIFANFFWKCLLTKRFGDVLRLQRAEIMLRPEPQPPGLWHKGPRWLMYAFAVTLSTRTRTLEPEMSRWNARRARKTGRNSSQLIFRWLSLMFYLPCATCPWQWAPQPWRLASVITTNLWGSKNWQTLVMAGERHHWGIWLRNLYGWRATVRLL